MIQNGTKLQFRRFAEPHHFDAALVPSKNFDAAPALALTLIPLGKLFFNKQLHG
jgi:hypothetical protein